MFRLLPAAVVAALLLGGGAATPGAAELRQYPPSGGARGPGAALPTQYGDPGRAALEARALELEEELRRLTGRIEELEYQQNRLISRLERLEDDADERRRTAEAPPPPADEPAVAAAPETEAPPPPPPPHTVARAEPSSPARPAAAPPPTPGPAARQPAPDVEPDGAAAKGYVLGTIPRGAAGTPAPAPGRTPPTTGGGVPAAARPAPAGDVGYDGALGLLQAGRWAEAEQAFRGFIDKTPEDPRAASAAFWLGETYFFRKDYPNAAATFARNYRTYGPEAQKAPDNLLKLGMSLSAMGDKGKACQTFGELAKRHPTAPAPVRQTLARERSAAACA